MSVAHAKLHVVCLCAAWCQTCAAYRRTFDAVAGDLAARGLAHAPRWIDIEDDAALVDDVDIETFPTLLVYDDALLRFAGPLTPQPETLRRLLESLAASPSTSVNADAAVLRLVERLRRAPHAAGAADG